MHTKHHLNEQMRMGYAAGVLPEAFNLVVACHLCLSDEGRAMQSCYDALGGAVLNKCEQERMSMDALSATMHQIKTCPCDTAAPEVCTGIFPQPLQGYIGAKLESIRWRSLRNGVRQATVRTTKCARVRLLYVPAGQTVPDHGRHGTELMLVLQGAYVVDGESYHPGDIEVTPAAIQHHAVAQDGEVCICLSATDTPHKIPHLLRKLFQLFHKG